MQPNWDVIRKILLRIEDLPKAGSLNSMELANEWVDSNTVSYNIVLLFDYGLIDGILKKGTSGSLWCEVIRMTSKGHEFLDTVRQDIGWKKIKEKAKEIDLELNIQVITNLKITVDQLLNE
jgi:hypothetical protein